MGAAKKVTAIRAPTSDIDNHTVVLRQLKETVEMLLGVRGDSNNRAVTMSDLVAAGLARNVNGTVQQPGLFVVYEPSSLTATPIPGGIQFTFSVPANIVAGTVFDLLEYTASTPYTSASVVMSGAAQAFVLPKSDTITRYYWIRTRLPNGQVSFPYPVTAANPSAPGVAAAASIADSYTGAWNNATAYTPGDEVSVSGNYYLCTAANTNHTPPNVSFWLLVGPQSQDNLTDGSTYMRFLAANLDGSRRVAPAVGAISPISCIPINVIDSTALNLSYTSTPTTITISWNAATVYFADGTTASISAASVMFSGATPSTTYHFYPYCTPPALGACTVAISGWDSNPNASMAALCYEWGRLPLTPFTATTPASGTGGGGGGGTGCMHPSCWIELADGQSIRAGRLCVGDMLQTPDGEAPVLAIERASRTRWIMVNDKVLVTEDHRFYKQDKTMVRAAELRIGDIISPSVEVRELALVLGEADMVAVHLPPPHLHYLGGMLSHNGNPKP